MGLPEENETESLTGKGSNDFLGLSFPPPMVNRGRVSRTHWGVSIFELSYRTQVMSILEKIKEFIKNEDPIVWKSLIIAAIATLAFYAFVLIVTAK